MTRFARFEIEGRCHKCGQPVPINGPVRHVTCGACLERVPVYKPWIIEFCRSGSWIAGSTPWPG